MVASQSTIRITTNSKISAADKLHDMLVFIIMTHRETPLTLDSASNSSTSSRKRVHSTGFTEVSPRNNLQEKKQVNEYAIIHLSSKEFNVKKQFF